MSEFVKQEVTDHVAIVTLNRPQRLNAIGNEMGRQFDETMVRIALDRNIRAVILTGQGRGFCAGADMERISGLVEDDEAVARLAPAGGVHRTFTPLSDTAPPEVLTRYNCPQALPQPVIAAVNGPCAGIGLALAVMCDVRFASTAAFFVAPFGRRGLTAETGIASSLAAIVGFGHAADMLLSGRRVDATEALQMGLANRLCDPEALLPEALIYANDLARNVSPRSAHRIKFQLWKARSQDFAAAASDAIEEYKASMSTEDFKEGIAHFKEKRPPRFTGR
jgi:enoyl-CoA hydratase/carnithine racemase